MSDNQTKSKFEELQKLMQKSEKRQEALKILIQKKVLIPFDSEMHLYHGRVNTGETEKFKVIPKFNNAGNATGNKNVNSISGLHVSDEYNVAENFSKERYQKWCEKNPNGKLKGKPEVHKIVASSPDCYFVNDYRLNHYASLVSSSQLTRGASDDLNEVHDAFLMLIKSYGFSEILPVQFEKKDVYVELLKEINKFLKVEDIAFLSEKNIEKLCNNISIKNIENKDIINIASGVNTWIMLLNVGLSHAVFNVFCYNDSSSTDKYLKMGNEKYPLNTDFFSALCDKMGIIGVMAPVYSATIDQRIKDYLIFETSKVNTAEFIAKQKARRSEIFGSIGEILENCISNKIDYDFLITSSPEETMAYLQTAVPQLQKYYECPAGVWEGFSVGEHTETALRVLDDSFCDDLPPEILPFLKLTVAMHDVGKGVVRKEGIKSKEKEDEISMQITEKVMKKLGMDEARIKLMKYLISESLNFTNEIMVKKDQSDDMAYKWRKSLEKIVSSITIQENKDSADSIIASIKKSNNNNSAKNKSSLIRGLGNLAYVIQTCDSGAYTRMGVTRDKDSGAYYFNGNDRFTETMEQPKDLAGRRQRFK